MANYHRLPPFGTHKEMQLYADSYHPPCYYVLCAAIWAIAHPLLGRAGTILLLRLLSGLMGAGVVVYTYRTARLLTTKQTALLAAACVAGIPMFVDVAASVSNEILSAFAAAVALYYLTLGMKRGFGWRETLLMSLWIAIGVCSKYTCAGIIPAAWLALWWTGRRRQQPSRVTLQMMSVVVGLSALGVGWFLLRNLMLYGDLFRLKVWEHYWPDIDGFKERHARTQVSWKRYTAQITEFGWMSFWGCFDRIYKTMPQRVYTCLGLLNLLTLAGVVLLYFRGWFQGLRGRTFLAISAMTLVLVYQYYKFNWWHCSPQGRYFFPLLVPFGILTAAGWLALFPRRLKWAAAILLMLCLLVLNIYVYAKYPLHPVTVENLPPLYARQIAPTGGYSHSMNARSLCETIPRAKET